MNLALDQICQGCKYFGAVLVASEKDVGDCGIHFLMGVQWPKSSQCWIVENEHTFVHSWVSSNLII